MKMLTLWKCSRWTAAWKYVYLKKGTVSTKNAKKLWDDVFKNFSTLKVVLVIIIFLPSFTLCIFFPLGNIRNFCRDYTLQSRFRTYILVCTFISPLKLKCITSHKELFSLRTAYLNSKDKSQDLSGKRAWERTYPKSRKFLTFFIKRTFPLKFTHKTRTKGLFIESMAKL